MTVKVLLGFDTERPFGPQGETPGGRAEREANLELIGRLNDLMDSNGARRTFFLLGTYLQQSTDQLGENHLRQVFDPTNQLIEIAQHTYTHPTIAPIKTRPDKTPISSKDLRNDLSRAEATIRTILGVDATIGLRTPLGYSHGELSGHEALDVMRELGLKYVSSSLRDKNGGINAPLVEDGQPRQPFVYDNGLIEIPSHGWQDSALTGTSKTEGTRDFPTTPDEIFGHYIGLITQAKNLSERSDNDVYIGFCMHPWAIRTYDPELMVLDRILDFTSQDGFENRPYRQASEDLD